MEIKILQVFYGKDGLPYKDKDRQVHFPITGTGFLGASNTTQIKFYYDELDNLDETTWVAVSKLPNGRVGSRVLESHLDSELNEHYALLELDNYYTQYKGDVFISLQGYQGGVDFDYDEENSQYEIHGTPTIAATGSIKFTINYANQFVGSGQTDNINFQRILAALGTKLGMRAYSEYVEELPSEGSPDVFYVINDEPSDPYLQNIYVWNENTRHYIWVGDNTLDLGNYYTQEQGNQFEENTNEELENYGNRITNVESELSSLASGSPKGVYATLAALQAAYPTGTTGIYVVSADGHWYYWNGSAWADGGVYQAVEIQRGQITYDMLNENAKPYDIVASANIYNHNAATNGYYYAYNSGVKYANASMCYSEYIDVYGETNVTFSRFYNYSLGSCHVCFFDQNKQYISGGLATGTETTLSIPNGAYYMIFSCGISQKDSIKIEFGSTKTYFSPYISVKAFGKEKVDIYIDEELVASDYNWFRRYLQAAGEMASENHWIYLHIPNGTYNTYIMFTPEEQSDASFKGMFVPDYVFLVGESVENTVLTTTLNAVSTAISTLNFANTCGIENMTVEGNKTRYAIHDDFANPTQYDKHYYRIVKNCKFKGTDTAYGIYGSGSKSGAIWYFENIETPQISWHSNINFELPNDITFKNIQITSKGGTSPFVLKSLGSGVINRIHIIGCDIPILKCWEEVANIGYDFEIDGYGNNEFVVNWQNANHPIQLFSDRISLLYANTTYPKGMPIYKSAQVFGKAFNPYRMTGILLEDCVSGDLVHILTSGYYELRDLGLDTTLANGTLITVSASGELVVGSSSDHIIGIIDSQWDIKCLRLF